MTRHTIFTLCFLLTACASVDPQTGEREVSEELKSTPQYLEAKRFDSLLRGTLAESDIAAWKKECATAKSPFCYSVLKEKRLRAFLVKEQNRGTVMWEKPEPITPVYAKGRVQNWAKMQKANLKALLAGMRGFSAQELQGIGKFALGRPECPNHIAISTAALLELFLNTDNVATDIAKLYEKGARCTRRGSANQEHYLTRAALFWIFTKQYTKAEKLLAKIKPSDAYSGRAAYWLYRTRTLLGQTEAARAALNRLKNQHPLSFHALMLHTQQNTDPLPAAPETPLATRSKLKPGVNVLIEQAEILRQMGFTESAAGVVGWAFATQAPSEPAVRAYLSSLGDSPMQIRTLQMLLLTRPALRTRQYYELAYPKSYLPLFESASSDPYLLLAIARKESHLDPKAISPANAQGLLQLNPETAKRLSGGGDPDLFDPKVNTELASRYIRELRSQMRDQLALVIASYNAGEQTVATWTQRYPTTDPLLFIDLIPYRETRDYVGFVLTNYYWYRRLYSDNPQAALSQLGGGEIARVDPPRETRSVQLNSETPRTSPLPGEETTESLSASDEAL